MPSQTGVLSVQPGNPAHSQGMPSLPASGFGRLSSGISVLFWFLVRLDKNWPGATPTPERAFGRAEGSPNGVAPGQFRYRLLSRKPPGVTVKSLRQTTLQLTGSRSRYRKLARQPVL